MGWLFKTPSDDAIEATLKALHWQNTLDNYYEYSWGWARTVLFTVGAMFITSAVESNADASLWETTVDAFVGWAKETVDGWV